MFDPWRIINNYHSASGIDIVFVIQFQFQQEGRVGWLKEVGQTWTFNWYTYVCSILNTYLY